MPADAGASTGAIVTPSQERELALKARAAITGASRVAFVTADTISHGDTMNSSGHRAVAAAVYGASVVALMEVPGDAISSYGAVDAEPVSHNSGKDRRPGGRAAGRPGGRAAGRPGGRAAQPGPARPAGRRAS